MNMRYFLKEWGLFTLIIIIIILSRLFVWQFVTVDGHSMDPTLADKEKLLMVKTTSLQRFDIVVASETDDDGKKKLIVKRIIGMPGDTIRYDNDVLYVNGKKVKEEYLTEYQKAFAKDKLQSTYSYNSYFKKSAKETEYFTQDAQKSGSFTVVVPEDEYFLLGDNRPISQDSRKIGNFKKSSIKGEIVFRFLPFNRIGFL